jgi:DHA1 family tetracycline resistance protein-like MFS transporter
VLSPTPGRFAVVFILITILLDAITFGILVPVLPALITELTGESLGKAATYNGFLMFIHAFMQFIFAPIFGNLSDRFGRRPILLLSMSMFGINYIIMGLATSVTWLFIGKFFAGIAGGTVTTANAYMADISNEHNRAKNFALISAAMGLGFILGPTIGGILGEFGTRVPLFFAAFLAFVNLIYGFFILPETLNKNDRRQFSWARANTIGTFREMRNYPMVFGLFGVLIFYLSAQVAHPSIWAFYTMLKFDWNIQQVGISLSVYGCMTLLVQGFAIGYIVKRIGEEKATYIGLFIASICFIGYASATHGWMIYAWIIPGGFAGLALPSIRSIMSKEVPSNRQGELQGAITSIQSLVAMSSPLLMTQIFNTFTSAEFDYYLPGAPFYASGIFVFAALILFLRCMKIKKKKNNLEKVYE